MTPFLLQLFNSVFLLFIRDIVIKINFSIVFSLTLKKQKQKTNYRSFHTLNFEATEMNDGDVVLANAVSRICLST